MPDKIIHSVARGGGGSTLALTIDAPPDAIQLWLVQVGQDRAGFYSLVFTMERRMLLGLKARAEGRPDAPPALMAVQQRLYGRNCARPVES